MDNFHHRHHAAGYEAQKTVVSFDGPSRDSEWDKPHTPCSFRQKCMGQLRRLRTQGVSVPIMLAFGCLMFFAGRFAEQSTSLPTPDVTQAVAGPGEYRRALQSVTAEVAQVAVVPSKAVGQVDLPADPLDSVQLESFMLESSGFLRLRPPLMPSVSGDNFYHAIPFQVLSWYPRILLFPGFLDKQKCEHVIALAKKQLAPSQLLFKKDDDPTKHTQTRTSSGAFLSFDMDSTGILSWIEHRIAAATHLPVGNGEPFNVLRYQNTQHYDSHLDAFDPEQYGVMPSQRIATFLTYLADVEEGGETVFKREGEFNANKPVADLRNCGDDEFKVKPKQGDAVLFWDVTPEGKVDPRAMHGACPVIRGEKWSMAKWIRDKPFPYRTQAATLAAAATVQSTGHVTEVNTNSAETLNSNQQAVNAAETVNV